MARQGQNRKLGTAIAVAGVGAIVYTTSQEIRFGQEFGLFIKFASAGTPNVQIDVQESTDAASPESTADLRYVIPNGVAALGIVNDKLAHIYGIPLRPMKFMRFVLTGLAGNPSDTTAEVVLFVQEPGN